MIHHLLRCIGLCEWAFRTINSHFVNKKLVPANDILPLRPPAIRTDGWSLQTILVFAVCTYVDDFDFDESIL